jgi:hypothetical protein
MKSLQAHACIHFSGLRRNRGPMFHFFLMRWTCSSSCLSAEIVLGFLYAFAGAIAFAVVPNAAKFIVIGSLNRTHTHTATRVGFLLPTYLREGRSFKPRWALIYTVPSGFSLTAIGQPILRTASIAAPLLMYGFKPFSFPSVRSDV